MPLLSIITINYNNGKGLQKTIESVVNQTWKDFEYLIVDGGSNDGSAELLKQYQPHLAYAVSEADNGVFHAMNKGAQAATGNYLLFLNSGDILNNAEALATLAKGIELKPNKAIYYTNLLLIDPQTEVQTLHKCPEKLSLAYFTGSFIGHPASLINRKVFEEMGRYAEHYQIIADWLFFVQAFLKGYSFQYVDMTLSTFFLGGMSSTGSAQHAKELQQVYQNELNFIAADMASLIKLNSRVHKAADRLLKYIRGSKTATTKP